MQRDVQQQRADHPALGSSLPGWGELAVLDQTTVLEQVLDQDALHQH